MIDEELALLIRELAEWPTLPDGTRPLEKSVHTAINHLILNARAIDGALKRWKEIHSARPLHKRTETGSS